MSIMLNCCSIFKTIIRYFVNTSPRLLLIFFRKPFSAFTGFSNQTGSGKRYNLNFHIQAIIYTACVHGIARRRARGEIFNISG